MRNLLTSYNCILNQCYECTISNELDLLEKVFISGKTVWGCRGVDPVGVPRGLYINWCVLTGIVEGDEGSYES